ncbi:hypothetical protein SADUNF_Sadunf16G0012600 [Salix dunnii]|uniref:DUF4408 domain-containing protein n=1 Tax=Salix dunnii TaxID=1413687 RepID=A0A835J6J8_9ROSI|nr:hypothetical protein SADUNF_Sadunf16G0012600 [Salix dunnii]
MQDQTYQYHVLRILRFLIPVSLFSLFLCFSSGFPLFPKPMIFYINTGVFSFFSHYLERKYMFLICNGILAILAKSSVSSSEPTLYSAKAEATVDDQEVHVASVEPLKDIVLATEEEEEETASSQALISEEEEYMEDNTECMVKQEEEEEEEEEEEGNEELTSTEELNRRFEEFIRKMKEEIRIEAQQQLIAV